jgi:hypothetical protein
MRNWVKAMVYFVRGSVLVGGDHSSPSVAAKEPSGQGDHAHNDAGYATDERAHNGDVHCC